MKKVALMAILATLPMISFATPKYIKTSDYIAVNSNKSWQWSVFSAMPNVKKWQNKSPKLDTNYADSKAYKITGSLANADSFTAYGTKNQPIVLEIGSAVRAGDEDGLSLDEKLGQVFNKNELVQIKSNCSRDDDFFTQHFYKWQKKGMQPLYVYGLQSINNGGTINAIGIAHNFNDFFTPNYANELDVYDSNGNKIVCKFN